MELAQKNRIIKRFLLENSLHPSQTNLAEDIHEEYAELGKLLDYIEIHNRNLINFDALEHQERQWVRLQDVLRSICKLTPGNPPRIEKIDYARVEPTLRYFRDLKAIRRLPKDDYFSRVVKPLTPEDDELLDLVSTSQKILYRLSQDFPHAKAFDPTSSLQIINQINEVQKQLKKYQEGHPHNTMLQTQLTILLDLQKINSLHALVIPQDRGHLLVYCTLPDSAGGVTEKVSLIPMTKVKQQLGNLTLDPSLSLESYTSHRQQFKLATEAILKLPKHGEITEVQREAMALNISRLLRRNNSTAQSTTVSYNNHPALFIPFADIRLLSDFTLGTTFTAGLGITGQTYTHYSTIKAVGEGIQGDHFVDDFGDALGLLYLSSDTDAIGGYCQNKALTNNRHLFIFDQVIMATDKFLLDARLSLQPDQLLVKHTRHGQGRNRTVIEDSSMTTKFDSIMQLKAMNNRILLYLTNVYWVHHERVVELKTVLQQPLDKEQRKQVEQEIKDLEILAKDASIIKTAVSKRIMEIDKILPKAASDLHSHDVCQAMILAKLLQPPRLFTVDGRPYKYPWTERPALQVDLMKEQEGIIYIRFNEKIPESHLKAICQAGNFKVKQNSDRELLIKKSDLAKINETMLYPECNLQFLPNHRYLSAVDFHLLANAYDKAKKEEIYQCIRQYQEVMHDDDLPITERVACITHTESLLNKHLINSKDQGYGKHVLKKFYFDTQQKLQAMIHPRDCPLNIVSAFESALKLDRLSIFNQVVAEAISQDKLHDANFLAFLDHCQQHAVAAIDHPHAERESDALLNEARNVLHHLKSVQQNHGIHMLLSSHSDGALTRQDTSVSPVLDLEEDLQEERELLTHLNTLNLETPTTLTTRLRDNEDDNLNNKLN